MSKETIVIALGTLVIITTQLGIPSSWRVAIIVLSGLALIAVGFFLRAEALARGSKRTSHHQFVENGVSVAPDTVHEPKSGITSLN